MPEREIEVYVLDPPDDFLAHDYEGYLNHCLNLERRMRLERYTQNNITVTVSKSTYNDRPHVFTLTISSPTASERTLYNFTIDLCDSLAYSRDIGPVHFTPGGRRSRRKSRRSKSRRSKSRRSKSRR